MAEKGKGLIPVSYNKPFPIVRDGRISTSREFSDMPDLLAEIAEVVGRDAALDIAYLRGGRRAHFPAKAPDNHWLVRTIGREAADKLCKHFCVTGMGGVMLTVPLGETTFYAQAKKQALVLRARGDSIATVARKLGISTRSVEKWTAAAEGIAEALQQAKVPLLFDRKRIEDDT